EGVTVEVKKPKHSIMRGIRWTPSPMFTGYNLVEVKEEGEVLATFKETGDAMIVAWNYGKGRAIAITTGIAPPWGSSFHECKDGAHFLERVLLWVAALPEAG